MFESILIGDDGTPEAERAVNTALALGRAFKAQVIVLGVVRPPSAEAQAEGYGLDRSAKARATLERKFADLMQTGGAEGISLVTEIIEGNPEEIIEREAEKRAADLIVVGHRDVNRVRRWLEGSTSEDLFKDSKVSVLVVRSEREP